MSLFCMTYTVNSLEQLNKARKQFLEKEKFNKIFNIVVGKSLNSEKRTLEIWYDDGRHNDGIWRDEMKGDIKSGSFKTGLLKK